MEGKNLNRRKFIKKNTIAGLGLGAGLATPTGSLFLDKFKSKLAIHGGTPAVDHDWPSWPIWNQQTDEKRVLDVLRSGVWSRNKTVAEFESKWAEVCGAKRCLTLVNGTNALNTALAQLEIGWGDEVLVTPYSFIASVSCIMLNGAIPVFVDVDPETFQMDPEKLEAKITSNTRAILPVHILGLPSDMLRINKIAEKHNLLVVEDACQGWLAEINGKKVGTFGQAGCFSFQNSKNLPMGEGGAIVSDDEAFIDRCYSYHNYGNAYGSLVGSVGSGAVMVGTKLRLTEYQAAIGLAQLDRLEDQTKKRSENAEALRGMIAQIPGIKPYVLYPEVTRASFHLFPFRYKKEEFKGLSRNQFLSALRAEGVPCSSGYTPLNKMPYLKNGFESKNFKRFYSADRLDYQKYEANNRCPLNDQLCTEAVWIPQNVLLGSAKDMTNIATAIKKVHANADSIK